MALRAFAALRQTPSCRKTRSESGCEESGKRVDGVKGGSSFHLSTPDEAAATTPCSILLEQSTPTVSVEIEGLSRSLIIDTGSNVSILQPAVSSRGVRITQTKPHGVTGDALDVKGLQTVTFLLNRRE